MVTFEPAGSSLPLSISMRTTSLAFAGAREQWRGQLDYLAPVSKVASA
jgi:hypothetical protein